MSESVPPTARSRSFGRHGAQSKKVTEIETADDACRIGASVCTQKFPQKDKY